MRKVASVFCSLSLAAYASAAAAMPVSPIHDVPSTLIQTVRWCPPGTHQGYEGKYCWADKERTCPRGYHIGYEGKYCWPNK
jgi:hypothetical protein